MINEITRKQLLELSTALDRAERNQVSVTDDPEGLVTVQISDTMVKEMSRVLLAAASQVSEPATFIQPKIRNEPCWLTKDGAHFRIVDDHHAEKMGCIPVYIEIADVVEGRK